MGGEAIAAAIGAVVGVLTGGIAQFIVLRSFRRRGPVTQQAIDAVADRVVEQLTHRVDPSQAWFWTPEWQEGEREADREIASGRGTLFKSPEDFEEYLANMASSHPAGRSAT